MAYSAAGAAGLCASHGRQTATSSLADCPSDWYTLNHIQVGLHTELKKPGHSFTQMLINSNSLY